MKKLHLLALALLLTLTFSIVGVAQAQITQDAQIAELMARISELQQQINTLRAASNASPTALANTPLSGAIEALTRNLSRGQSDAQTNGEVSRLQRTLTQIPEARFTAENVTGFFGPLTEAAVRRVQEANSIVTSGTAETTGYGAVGPRTRETINRIYVRYPKILPPTPGGSLTTNNGITVLSPNGGETWTKGKTETIKWTDTTPIPNNPCTVGGLCGATVPNFYDIQITRYQEPCTTYCITIGYAPRTIAKGVGGMDYEWSIGKVLESSSLLEDGLYTMSICSVNRSSACDKSDSYFKIVSGTIVAPPITVLSPNGGETFKPGDSVKILWQSNIPIPRPDLGTIYLDNVNGGAGVPIAANVHLAGPEFSYVWTIPSTIALGSYRIRIFSNDLTWGASDSSDSYFKIVSGTATAGSLTVLEQALLLGDVNTDGVVDLADTVVLTNYLSTSSDTKTFLTTAGLKNANLDGNGAVDQADLFILRKTVLGIILPSDLPIKWGDIDNDGVVGFSDNVLASNLARGLSTNVTAKGRLAGDVDMDGSNDSADNKLISGASLGLVTLPAVWGDVSGNFIVDLADTSILSAIVGGTSAPTTQQRYVGDVYNYNNDSLLSEYDLTTLRQFVLGTISDLPVFYFTD